MGTPATFDASDPLETKPLSFFAHWEFKKKNLKVAAITDLDQDWAPKASVAVLGSLLHFEKFKERYN